MRAIKFRAWNREKKVMSFEFEFDSFDGSYFIPEGWSLYEMEIMQFTGLFDKNGKEIYEGDVVDSDQGVREIKWEQCGFSPFHENGWGDWNENNMVVIGNIYENPELLK
jgi:hypothetical protein